MNATEKRLADWHAAIAKVASEISIALVRRKLHKADATRWREALAIVIDQMRQK